MRLTLTALAVTLLSSDMISAAPAINPNYAPPAVIEPVPIVPLAAVPHAYEHEHSRRSAAGAAAGQVTNGACDGLPWYKRWPCLVFKAI